MEYFSKLGLLVGRLWKEQNYDERQFPMVAVRGLSELPPDQNASFWDTVQWGLTSEPLLFQCDITAEFGQPPLTVFWGRQFRIEVLFWVRGLPGVHEHAFSGAFHVLHGSSIHTHWQFEPEERINTKLLLGKTLLKKAEILNQGDSRPIISGPELIHTTFHLECPSVSVVIRTNQEQDRLPQLVYMPPSVAYASQDPAQSVRRRNQILHMLFASGKRTEYFEMLRHLFGTSDLYSVFMYLLQVNTLIKDEETRQNLLLAARIKHPCFVEAVEPAMAYARRQEEIRKIRERTNNPDIQFVLGLLMNIPDRDFILELLKLKYSARNSVTVLLDAISELMSEGLLGPRFNSSWMTMLEALLSGLSDEQIRLAFAERYGSAEIDVRKNELNILAQSLRNWWFLKPLWQMQERRLHAVQRAGLIA